MVEPRETIYNGQRFRSGLSACWVVFFEALGVSYEYQTEGRDLDGARYLPDFWLPAQQCWVAVKDSEATPEDKGHAFLLTLNTEQPAYLFAGVEGRLRVPDEKTAPPLAYRFIPEPDLWDGIPWFCWGECPYCRTVGFEYVKGDEFLPCGCLQQHFPQVSVLKITGGEGIQTLPGESAWAPAYHRLWWEEKVAKGLSTADSPRLRAAYSAAYQARFKFRTEPREEQP